MAEPPAELPGPVRLTTEGVGLLLPAVEPEARLLPATALAARNVALRWETMIA
jgi:hypothetical protein